MEQKNDNALDKNKPWLRAKGRKKCIDKDVHEGKFLLYINSGLREEFKVCCRERGVAMNMQIIALIRRFINRHRKMYKEPPPARVKKKGVWGRQKKEKVSGE